MWVHRFPSLSKMFINIVLREAKNKTRARSSAGQIHWFSKLLRVHLKKVHPKALLRQSTLSPLSDKVPLLPCGELLFIIWLCTWLCDDKGRVYKISLQQWMNEEEVRKFRNNACGRKLKGADELYLSIWNKNTTLRSEKKLLGVLNKVGREKSYFLCSWPVHLRRRVVSWL